MDLQLTDQHVAVVGGASGIGLAIAGRFHAEGARVAILDRAEDTDARAAELGSAVRACRVDVTDAASVTAAAASLEEVNHVVLAAAVGSGRSGFPFWNLQPEDWRQVIEVNVLGLAICAHAFAPRLIARPGNTLLFLASVAGQIGSPTDPPYSASKAAAINFMQCAARDFAPYGVRANALSPGMVRTPLNREVWAARQEALPPDERQSYEAWAETKIRAVAPLGRWQRAEEMAAMAAFIASPHAANITGQTLNIDGGQVMHS